MKAAAIAAAVDGYQSNSRKSFGSCHHYVGSQRISCPFTDEATGASHTTQNAKSSLLSASTVARQACRTSTLQQMSDAAGSACSRPARRTLKSTSRPADWRYGASADWGGSDSTAQAWLPSAQHVSNRPGRPDTLLGCCGLELCQQMEAVEICGQ